MFTSEVFDISTNEPQTFIRIKVSYCNCKNSWLKKLFGYIDSKVIDALKSTTAEITHKNMINDEYKCVTRTFLRFRYPEKIDTESKKVIGHIFVPPKDLKWEIGRYNNYYLSNAFNFDDLQTAKKHYFYPNLNSTGILTGNISFKIVTK